MSTFASMLDKSLAKTTTTASTTKGQQQLPSTEELELPQYWTFWYLIRPSRGALQSTNYEHALHSIATICSAEDFWSLYGHLCRPADLPTNSDYQVFREGVKPTWEDSTNSEGGKW